jgi:hypothetical protein
MVCRLTIGRERATGLLLACVLFSGCTMPNPAFDNDNAEDATGDPSTSFGDTNSTDESGTTEDTGTEDTGTEDTGSETAGIDDTGPGANAIAISAYFAGCRGESYTPAECALFAGGGQLDAIVIDESSDAGHYLVACLAFALDDTLVDKVVTEVTLEMHTINQQWAGSNASGEIWAVDPFTPVNFAVALPAQVGDSPLAPNPGAGPISVPIYWVLPNDLVTPNSHIYLCAYPLSDDGIYFYSHVGMFPPTLYIDYK